MENRFQEMSDYLNGRRSVGGRRPTRQRGDPTKDSKPSTAMAVRSNGLTRMLSGDAGTADSAGARSVSAAGVDFIKQFEGFERRPKEAPAGHCSVGYGRLLAKGDYDGVPDELRKWTKARVGGRMVDLQGLVRRRGAEAQLWQKAVTAQPSH